MNGCISRTVAHAEALDFGRSGSALWPSTGSCWRLSGETKPMEKASDATALLTVLRCQNRTVPLVRVIFSSALACGFLVARSEQAGCNCSPGLTASLNTEYGILAQPWRGYISTNRRALRRPRGWRMVCWRSAQNGPDHIRTMVGLPAHTSLLYFWQECCEIRSGIETEGASAII